VVANSPLIKETAPVKEVWKSVIFHDLRAQRCR